MRIAVRAFPLSILSLALVVLAAACQKSEPPPYVVTATIKDLMQSVIDPSADVVWESVSAVSNEKGLTEIRPQTDEDWKKVRHGAVALAEATNLLMMPGRHVARPGEKSETPGVELEPQEMEDLINKDVSAFYKRAGALREAAVEVLAAIDKKDAEKVFEVGEHIERACEGCHMHYWYPNEKIPTVVVSPDAAPPTTTPAK